jgi:hypothetical protein
MAAAGENINSQIKKKPTYMPILIFKTDIVYKSIAKRMTRQLEKLPGVIRSNFDLFDNDKILRVETSNLPAAQVQQLVESAGYFCRELED